MARRKFSSSLGDVRTETSCVFGSGDSTLFLKNLKSAHEHKDKIGIELPEAEFASQFASQFRPLFALNCVMLPCKLKDDTTAYLHGQVQGFTKQWPLYLSSRDFMLRVKSCNEEQVKHLVDYIIERRVLISEDWDHSYGNIELLRCKFRYFFRQRRV